MRKAVKITVVKSSYFDDVAERYAIDDLGPCPLHTVGQVLWSDGEHQPAGMCAYAWLPMADCARRLSRGELAQPAAGRTAQGGRLARGARAGAAASGVPYR